MSLEFGLRQRPFAPDPVQTDLRSWALGRCTGYHPMQFGSRLETASWDSWNETRNGRNIKGDASLSSPRGKRHRYRSPSPHEFPSTWIAPTRPSRMLWHPNASIQTGPTPTCQSTMLQWQQMQFVFFSKKPASKYSGRLSVKEACRLPFSILDLRTWVCCSHPQNTTDLCGHFSNYGTDKACSILAHWQLLNSGESAKLKSDLFLSPFSYFSLHLTYLCPDVGNASNVEYINGSSAFCAPHARLHGTTYQTDSSIWLQS